MSVLEYVILILAIIGGPIWIVLFFVAFLRLPTEAQQMISQHGTIPTWKILTWFVSIVICLVFLFKAIF